MRIRPYLFIHLVFITVFLLGTVSYMPMAQAKPAQESGAVDDRISCIRTLSALGGYRVVDWYDGLSDVLIIAVRDFHASYPTQLMYAPFLQSLIGRNESLGIGFIGLEGSSGWIDTSVLRSYPDSGITRMVADQFLKNGTINGLEYFAITASEPIALYGIDDPQLYKQNAEVFFRVHFDLKDTREQANRILSYLKDLCARQSVEHLNDREAEFIGLLYGYLEGSVDIFSFARTLGDLADQSGVDIGAYPNCLAVKDVIRMQNGIDMRRLEQEKDELLLNCRQILKDEDYKQLVRANIQYSIDQMSFTAFYTVLDYFKSEYSIDIKPDSELARMFGLVEILDGLHETHLNSEFASIFADIIAVSGISSSAGIYFDIFTRLAVVQNMLNLNASRDEYDYFINTGITFESLVRQVAKITPSEQAVKFSGATVRDIDHLLALADQFYRVAIERDGSMIDNALLFNGLTGSKTVVLVGGGFHTAGFARFLREESVSYVVLSPRISGDDLTSSYMSMMENKKSGIDNYFDMLRTLLMPSSNLKNLLNPDNRIVLFARWALYASVLSSVEDFRDFKLNADILKKEFSEREERWKTQLRRAVETDVKHYGEGVISAKTATDIVDSFTALIDAIEFDLDHSELFERTLLVPVIIRGGEETEFVISVRLKNDEAFNIEEALNEIESLNIGEFEVSVIPRQSLEIVEQLSKLDRQIGLSMSKKQNFFVLLDLFGKKAIDDLLDRYPPFDIDDVLLNLPSYKDIRSAIELIGVANAKELLLLDPIGFSNIVYAAKQSDTEEGHNGLQEFVQTVLRKDDSRFLQSGENFIPEYVIQRASNSDLSEWYRYGVFRVFDRDFWEERLSDSDIFLRAITPSGRIIGLIAARYLPDEQAIFIDVLETCSQSYHRGVGTTLVKEMVKASMDAGFQGRIILDAHEDSKNFYFQLGFSTYDKYPEYYALIPERAYELLGKDYIDVKSGLSDIQEDESFFTEAKNIPFLTAIEWLGNLMKAYPSITREDKIFIVGQLMRIHDITSDQAQAMLKDCLANEGSYVSSITDLYDAMVDAWVLSQSDTDLDDTQYLAENRLSFADLKPVDQYAIPQPSPDVRSYLAVVDSINRMFQVLEPYGTGEPVTLLRDNPFAIEPAKRVLREHAMALDIRIVPGEDHNLNGNIAALRDNIVYVNELVTPEEFWFVLPHELSHMLDGEYAARMHDVNYIKYIKELSAAFSEVAQDVSQPERRNVLNSFAARLYLTAARYELDVLTARLEMTSAGKIFMAENNIDPFAPHMDAGYRVAVASSLSQPVTAFPNKSMVRRIRKVLSDRRLNSQDFEDKLQRQLTGQQIAYSIKASHVRLGRIDSIVSSWLEQYVGRRYWNIEDNPVPVSLEPFIARTAGESGLLDIVALQRSIVSELRTMRDGAEKTKLEYDIAQWIARLISDRVQPQEKVAELHNVVKNNAANCLGYAKLYRAIAEQFGLKIRNAIVAFEVEGIVELHAVNLVQYNDGARDMINVAPITSQAEPVNIFVRVKEDDRWQLRMLSLDEYRSMDPSLIDGVSDSTVQAATLVTYASVANSEGRYHDALHYMTQAYQIDSDNVYVAFNMAVAQYNTWLRMYLHSDDRDFPSDEIRLQMMENLFQYYDLYMLGNQAWDQFVHRLTQADDPYVIVGMVDGIKGFGAGFNPYINRKIPDKADEIQKPAEHKPGEDQNVVRRQPEQDQKVDPDTVMRRLETESQLRRMQVERNMQTTNRTSTANALNQYQITQMMGDGLGFTTARHLLQVGSQIDALIQQQQYNEAMNRIMGLDPMFASRVMAQFPWIMALMLQMYPEWWLGPELRELARKANLSEEIQKEMRRRLTTVTGVNKTEDRDLFGRYRGENPLWLILHKESMKKLLNMTYNRGEVTDQQFRIAHELLESSVAESAGTLSPQNAKLLFGRRDAVPIEPGLRVENGFLLGGMFNDIPVQGAQPIYCRYMKTVVLAHPHETLETINRDGEAFSTDKLAQQFGIDVYGSIRDGRGALGALADSVFERVTDADIADVLAHESKEGDLSFVLESVMATNLVRRDILDLVSKIRNRGLVDSEQYETLSYLKKPYVEGDEKTPRFNKAFTMISVLMNKQVFIKDDIMHIALKLRHKNPGALLYALVQNAKQYDYAVDTTDETPLLPSIPVMTRRDLLDTAM